MENIVIRLEKLLDVFGKFNASEVSFIFVVLFKKNIIYTIDNLFTQDVWIGNALFDQDPTIIHHFARSNIYKYPHIVTGFGMTFKLLKRYVLLIFMLIIIEVTKYK